MYVHYANYLAKRTTIFKMHEINDLKAVNHEQAKKKKRFTATKMLYVHLFGKENQNIQNARNKPFQKSYQVFITHHQHNCLSRGMSYTATCFDNCHVV